jgi:hypothetical protein
MPNYTKGIVRTREEGFFYSLNVELTGRRNTQRGEYPTAQLLGGPR